MAIVVYELLASFARTSHRHALPCPGCRGRRAASRRARAGRNRWGSSRELAHKPRRACTRPRAEHGPAMHRRYAGLVRVLRHSVAGGQQFLDLLLADDVHAVGPVMAGRMVQFVMVAHIGLVVLSLVTEDCSVWLLGLLGLAVSLFIQLPMIVQLCCSPSLSQFQQERLGQSRSGHQLFSACTPKVQVPSFVR